MLAAYEIGHKIGITLLK